MKTKLTALAIIICCSAFAVTYTSNDITAYAYQPGNVRFLHREWAFTADEVREILIKELRARGDTNLPPVLTNQNIQVEGDLYLESTGKLQLWMNGPK